jgi:hypothetical protein
MEQESSPPWLTAEVARLLDAPNFAQLGTVDENGQPRIDTVWLARQGARLLVATTRRTRKARNLAMDARAYIVVVNRDDPYEQVQLKVALERMVDDADLRVCDAIAAKYIGGPFPVRHWPQRVALLFTVLDARYHHVRL